MSVRVCRETAAERSPRLGVGLPQPPTHLVVDLCGVVELEVVHPDAGEGWTTSLKRGDDTARGSGMDRTSGTSLATYCPGRQT